MKPTEPNEKNNANTDRKIIGCLVNLILFGMVLLACFYAWPVLSKIDPRGIYYFFKSMHPTDRLAVLVLCLYILGRAFLNTLSKAEKPESRK